MGGEGGNPEGGAGASSGTGGDGAGGSGGSSGSGPLSTGEVKLRLLTQAEYLASLRSLFGNVTTPLELPEDVSIMGYVSVGASIVSVNPTGAEKYEAASRAVVAEVFADDARWQALVGCEPAADLSAACVETFIRPFGRRAYRRDLTEDEVARWVQVARGAAMRGATTVQGLSTLASGLLQSLNFLYRAETNALDETNDRLKYDGRSMAVRLSYFLTGGPPSAELLDAGESGELDTADGVRTAAASMLADDAVVERLTAFFHEYSQVDLVRLVEKDATLFPDFDALRGSMRESTRLFLEKVVLAPNADVRSFFDSDQTFADATLAPLYGLMPPASGFAQFTLAPASGRAGIMGQAGILAGHSGPNFTSPTGRGLFMLQSFFCVVPEPPPPGVSTSLPPPELLNSTTRQKLEYDTNQAICQGCHVMFDPMGFALEHFDAIGRYRETENGLPIDASGSFVDGTSFNGARELGAALRENATVTECLLRNFYRSVNGRVDDGRDPVGIGLMSASLRSRRYVFRDLVRDFVASEAFGSAPRVPLE